MSAEASQLAVARRRAARRLGFLIHATVFVMVNVVLIAINLFTTPAHPWAVLPLLGWGFGLLMHGVAANGLFGRMREALVQRELARLPSPTQR